MKSIIHRLQWWERKIRRCRDRALEWRMLEWLRRLDQRRRDHRSRRWPQLAWAPSHISYKRPALPPGFPGRVNCNPAILVVSEESANGSANVAIGKAFGDKVSLITVTVASAAGLLRKKSSQIDFILFNNVGMRSRVMEIFAEARKLYLPTATLCDVVLHPEGEEIVSALGGDSSNAPTATNLFATFWAADFSICPDRELAAWSERNEICAIVPSDLGITGTTLLDEMQKRYRVRHLPSFSVVSILYGRSEQIEPVLESWFRQTYPGDFELIFVDDKSPDDSVAIANRCLEKLKASGKCARQPAVRVLRNEKNMGNCFSRNRGIAAATGDIVIVIDADCMVNADFLKGHADAHAFGDGDVVVGPIQQNIKGHFPLHTLAFYESSTDRILSDCRPQDPLNRQSFLNCVTRNFSIRRDFIEGDLFDPDFSYSMDPASGFGWEDVEMGYRLYARGARIKFTSDAFSLHISHPPSVEEKTKPLRSLLNFRRLHEKHPDLFFVARRWTLDTYDEICEWADKNSQSLNEDRKYLSGKFGQFLPQSFNIGNQRKLKILTYRWHVPHQYELYKLPYEFTLATGLGTKTTSHWSFDRRPLPENADMVPIEDINTRDYDLAILHFDENVLSPENTNGVIAHDWGRTFRWFQEKVDLPKVAICHGTPQFHGQYDINYCGEDFMEPIEDERLRMVNFLGDILVITNSHQAQSEWQFRRSKVIWHGFDPTEFPPAMYEKGILSPRGRLVTSRPHYRGYFLYHEVIEKLPHEFRPSGLFVPDPDFFYTEAAYAAGKFREYVNAVRRFSVYFNPTLRSPMPRARGEAMMCGLVTVSANNHDVDRFIENGVNGYRSNDADELRDFLIFLMKNPDKAKKIGVAGRRTAIDIFNHDRYLRAWEDTMSEVLGGGTRMSMLKTAA